MHINNKFIILAVDMAKMNHGAFLEKVLSQETFLVNDYEDMAYRSVPKDKTFIGKYRGDKHEQTVPGDSAALFDALLAQKTITREQYNKF